VSREAVRTLAILPVKSFGAAKQRLAGSLGAGSRQALAQAMFIDVLITLQRVPGLDEVVVVTPDHVAEAVATSRHVRVLPDTAQAGQSEAALIGIRHALAEGWERVLLVPGDTPLVHADELAELLAGARGVSIVPDRHGAGTNALVLAPPDAIEPSFGEGSLARHLAAAESSGLPHRVDELPSLALDVDTPDDLAQLAAELEHRHGQAPLTRGALHQIDHAGGLSRVPQAST
jgi:2-phospho-L-lactate/phosphoenolpyruvate guanylyltransferase